MGDPFSDPPPHDQLRWEIAAEARPGEPGVATVAVVGRNALVPEISFEMMVDWHKGAEAPDVEGRALVILSLLFKELAAECDRVAAERFAQG